MTDTLTSPDVAVSADQPSRRRRLLTQFIKFGLVGGSGVVVNTIVMVLLHHLHGGPEFADQQIINIPGTDFWVRYRNVVFVASFFVANIWNYWLNRRHTFESTGRSWWKDFWKFLGAGIFAASIGLAMQILFTHPDSPIYLPDPPFQAIGTWRSRELWAQLFGVVISTPFNFLVNKLWAFRTDTPEASGTPSVAGRP